MSSEPSPPRSVLLVEFVKDPESPRHGWLVFPYIQGLLKSAGIAVRWVYLPRTGRETDRGAWLPAPPVAEAVLGELRRLRPRAAVLSEECDDSFRDALTDAVPDAPPEVLAVRGEWGSILESLADLMGVPRTRAFDRLDFGIEPDYAAVNLLAAEFEEFPWQYLHPSGACRHAAPLRLNPHFAPFSLDGLVHEWGCSFCPGVANNAHRDAALSAEDRLARFGRELARWAATAPAERRRALVTVQDPALFPGFMERVLATPLEPTGFLIVRRANELLAARPTLERLIPEFAARGHRLVFDCVGMENFSPAENLRFNKHLTIETVEPLLNFLHGMEVRWPQTVWFFRPCLHPGDTERSATGIMMILFTPWTRAEDIRINLETLERLSLSVPPLQRLRYQLVSRLELRNGTAIARLAQRDGLLDEGFVPGAGPSVAHPRLEQGDEVPWRFADPEAERLHRFTVLLVSDRHQEELQSRAIVDPDPEVRRDFAWLAGLQRCDAVSGLVLFRLVFDALRELPLSASEAEVIHHLCELGRARVPESVYTPPSSWEPPSRVPEASAPPLAAEQGGAPAAPAAPATAHRRARQPAGDQPPVLRVVFRDRLGRYPDFAFFIGAADEGPEAFRRVGPLRLLHAPCRPGKVFELCGQALVAAMRSMGECPSAETLERWRATLTAAVARTPLPRRFDLEATLSALP
jgi:hypothetical protein